MLPSIRLNISKGVFRSQSQLSQTDRPKSKHSCEERAHVDSAHMADQQLLRRYTRMRLSGRCTTPLIMITLGHSSLCWSYNRICPTCKANTRTLLISMHYMRIHSLGSLGPTGFPEVIVPALLVYARCPVTRITAPTARQDIFISRRRSYTSCCPR